MQQPPTAACRIFIFVIAGPLYSLEVALLQVLVYRLESKEPEYNYSSVFFFFRLYLHDKWYFYVLGRARLNLKIHRSFGGMNSVYKKVSVKLGVNYWADRRSPIFLNRYLIERDEKLEYTGRFTKLV